MENRKIIIAILAVIAFSCSLLTLDADGWVLLKKGEIHLAHREFLRDYAYEPDSVRYSAGLSYTFFLMEQYDSSLAYINISNSIDRQSNYTFFSSLVYYSRFNTFKADTVYRDFIEKDGTQINVFIIDSFITSNELHKMGLMSIYKNGNYDYVYGVLKSISNIPDDLTMPDEAVLLLDYIESL